MTQSADDRVEGFYLTGSYVFDNFAALQIEWRGTLWPTAEHAYQAAHFMDEYPELVEEVRSQWSPREASDFANAHAAKDRADWKDIKLGIMQEICLCKLQQHPEVQQALLATGDKRLVEMSTEDSFWGWGPDQQGRNELGRIWMHLRDRLRAGMLDVEP